MDQAISVLEFCAAEVQPAHALITATPGASLLPWETPQLLMDFIHRNPSLSSVAFSDPGDFSQRKLIGCVLLGHDGLRAMFHHLVVHPDFRKAKVGTRLVRRSLESLYTLTAIRRVFFRVFGENESGRLFFESLPAVRRSSEQGGKIVAYTIDLDSDPARWAWDD